MIAPVHSGLAISMMAVANARRKIGRVVRAGRDCVDEGMTREGCNDFGGRGMIVFSRVRPP